MKKINLWDTYHEIDNLLWVLSSYDSSSPYQEMLDELKNKVEELYKYFGVRKLKIDIGSLKSGEVVQILQDESGSWLIPLRQDEHDIMVDLYDYMDISPADMFYE